MDWQHVRQTGMALDAGRIGLAVIAAAALLTTAIAAATMWTLLTEPARMATAASDGPGELFRQVALTVYDVMRRLLAWL